jgi:hypothetical protein
MSSTGPCRDCFSGTLHTGTPTGSIETIHGLPTYVARPGIYIHPQLHLLGFYSGRELLLRALEPGGNLSFQFPVPMRPNFSANESH